MMIEDCSFSESLVATYTSYKNGGRDREKLTPEQISTAFILESEFLLTAVYYFTQYVESLKAGESFDCISSPAHVIDAVDFADVVSISNIFLKSRLQEASTEIDKLEELMSNGAE